MKTVYRFLFRMLTCIGRPWGGIPPRRITNTLGRWAYEDDEAHASEFKWVRDKNGVELLLHPHFLIDRQIIAFGVYDARLHSFIRRNVTPGMICFDVGANIGAVALHMGYRVGDHGRIRCFEPVPHIAAKLKANIVRNGLHEIVSVNQLALGENNELRSMSIASQQFTNQGMGSLVEWDHGALTEAIRVPCQRLDDFLALHPERRLDLIKLDIQGAEPLFLKGAKCTLERFRPRLLLEVAPTSIAATGVGSDELLQVIQDLRYHIFELLPNGNLGKRLEPRKTSSTYAADNVVCIPI